MFQSWNAWTDWLFVYRCLSAYKTFFCCCRKFNFDKITMYLWPLFFFKLMYLFENDIWQCIWMFFSDTFIMKRTFPASCDSPRFDVTYIMHFPKTFCRHAHDWFSYVRKLEIGLFVYYICFIDTHIWFHY